MSRYSSTGAHGHRVRHLGGDDFRIAWTTDRYYSGSRLRHPRLHYRDTNYKGAVRFAQRHGCTFPSISMLVGFRGVSWSGGSFEVAATSAELAASLAFREGAASCPEGAASVREICVTDYPRFAVTFRITPFGLCRVHQIGVPPPSPPWRSFWRNP